MDQQKYLQKWKRSYCEERNRRLWKNESGSPLQLALTIKANVRSIMEAFNSKQDNKADLHKKEPYHSQVQWIWSISIKGIFVLSTVSYRSGPNRFIEIMGFKNGIYVMVAGMRTTKSILKISDCLISLREVARKFNGFSRYNLLLVLPNQMPASLKCSKTNVEHITYWRRNCWQRTYLLYVESTYNLLFANCLL